MLFVVGLLVVGLLAVRSAGDGDADRGDASAVGDESERERDVQDTLSALEAAWTARDRAGFVAAAGRSDQAVAWAGRTYAALAALDVDTIALRYAGQSTGLGAAGSGFSADVEVAWRPGTGPDPGYTTRPATVTLQLAVLPDQVEVLGLSTAGARPGLPLPAWLLGEVSTDGSARARCVGIDRARLRSCTALLALARRDVDAVLPAGMRRVGGPLVAYVPRTRAQAAALLGRSADALDGVAAVVSTLDASGSSAAPQVMVLNPDEIPDLAPRWRRLVVTHEAVHVATGAAASSMPLWVAEGFADWVALRDGAIPVRTAAAATLREVRRVGATSRLPTDAEFSVGSGRAGESYEQAWLLVRLLARTYGDDAVVTFYADVAAGQQVRPALQAAFATTPGELRRAWRRHLVALAG